MENVGFVHVDFNVGWGCEKMKKITIIFILFLVLIQTNAISIEIKGVLYKKITNNIFENTFNMCNCMRQVKKIYSQKRYIERKEICLETYTQLLMEKSKKCNCIITGVYVDNVCSD